MMITKFTKKKNQLIIFLFVLLNVLSLSKDFNKKISKNSSLNHSLVTCETVVWTGNVDNNWHNTANWNPMRIPLACDTVLINNVADSVNIGNGNIAIATKVVNNGKLTNDGTLNVEGSTAHGLTNYEGQTWNNGIINVNNTAEFGIWNWLGTFINSNNGKINIGTQGDPENIKGRGIVNVGTFKNQGQIIVEQTIGKSIHNGTTTQSWLESGTITVDNDFNNNGVLSAGDEIGVMHLNGDLLNPFYLNSSLEVFDLAGTEGGGQPMGHDSIFIDGSLVLNISSTIEIKLLNGFIPADTDEFVLIEYTNGLTNKYGPYQVNLPSPEMDGWIIDHTEYGKITLRKPAACATNIWTGCIDNNWHNALNWNLRRVPNACDSVEIKNDSVHIANNMTAVAAKVFINGGKLAIDETLDISGSSSDGLFNVLSTIWNNGTLNIDGVDTYGIENRIGQIWNNGSINIDNTGGNGIHNERSDFTNLSSGQINIGTQGGTNNIGDKGIYNIPFQTTPSNFINLGQITIENTQSYSIYNISVGGNGSNWIDNGILTISNEFYNDSYLSIGSSIDNLHINGVLSHTHKAIDTFELAGIGGGGQLTGHDSIFIDGNLMLDGTLEIKLINSFTPSDNDEFTLFTYTGILSGIFATVNLPSPEMENWQLDYSQSGKVILRKPTVSCGNISWTGNIDHDWHNPMNWNPMRIPSACDTVFMYSLADSVHISQVMPAEAAKIDNSGRIDIGGILNISGSNQEGILNFGRVWNSGTINVNDIVSTGISNSGGRFTNFSTGQINIGNQSAVPPNNGIVNLPNTATIFINEGQITVGNTTSENILNGVPIPIQGIWRGDGTINLTKEFSQNMVLSPSTMHIDGNLIHSTKAIDTFEIAGTAGGGQTLGHDSIYVNGNLATAGKLVIKLLGGFVPNNLDQFVLFEYTGNRTSSFSPIELPSPAMDGWIIDYSQLGKVLLKKQPAACGYISWTGNMDNNWNNANNWNLGRIPLACDTVLIYTDSVNINGVAAVGTRLVNAAKLTIDGSLTLDGSLENSILSATPSTIENNGILVCKNTVSAAIQNEGAFFNGGQLKIDQTGGALINENFFVNESGGTLNIGNDGGNITDDAIVNESNGLFVNQGQLIVDNVSGAGIWNKQTFHNESSGTMNFGQNGGAISGYAISNNVTGHFYNYGNINTATNSSIDIFNNRVISKRGTWYGEGTISMNNSFQNLGIITPGSSPGYIHFSGNLSHSSGSVDTFEIAGIAGGGLATGHDSVYIDGNLTLNGTLEVKLLNGFTPSDDAQFVLFDYTGTLSGTFSTVNLPSPAMDGWLIDYTQPNKVVLKKPSTDQPFITTWNTFNFGLVNFSSVTIPTTGTGYNYDVDWDNDGIYDNLGVTGNISHDYGSGGTYTIAIRGDFPRIHFANGGDKQKIQSIDQWGDIEWTTMASAFYGCGNLVINATDEPDLSQVTDMSFMFADADNIDAGLENWDVRKITNMEGVFFRANKFNGDISSWDVSKVTNMARLFQEAPLFNQNISSWEVGEVTDLSDLFNGAKVFNQNISHWDVSKVQNMSHLFFDAELFNQNIGNWQVGIVTDMGYMFYAADAFNQDISNWDVSKVTNMQAMFYSTDVFNQNLNDWNVSKVINMSQMFQNTKVFNQNLNNWQVGEVTNMESMFNFADKFNGDISNWNVSKVTNMKSMFRLAGDFNQEISNWNVGTVMDMSNMFYFANTFDQDLANWDITQATTMDDMLYISGLSKVNYDNTLIGWANQNVQSNVSLGARNLKYCLGESARNDLINNYNWTISEDIKDCSGTCIGQSIGGNISGATNVCGNFNSTTLALSGHTGSILNWESDTDMNFSNPINIPTNGTSHTALNLQITTYYRVKVQNGVCPVVYSDTIAITHTGVCDCPDLVISSLQVTDFSDNHISFSYTVKNIGIAPANLTGSTSSVLDNVGIQAYMTTDENGGFGQSAGGTAFPESAGTLLPNHTYSGSFTTTVTVDTTVRPYLELRLTGTQDVGECDRTNNRTYDKIDNPFICEEDNINISQATFSLYHGRETITSNAEINSNSSTVFKAGTSITLTEGFHAEGNFHALIEDCPDQNLVESVVESRHQEESATISELQIIDEKEVAVYPNPTNGLFTVALNTDLPTHLQLFDSSGQLLQSQKNIANKTALDLLDQPAGVYFIRLQAATTGQLVFKKIIKIN